MIEHSVYIDGQSIHLRSRRGLPGLSPWEHVIALPMTQAEQLVEHALRSTRPRLGVGVYLGLALCRVLSLAPVASVRSLQDYEAIAAHMFKERLGLLSSDWDFRIDPASPAGVVACAVRRSSLGTVEQVAKALFQRIKFIRPWGAVALSRAGAQRVGVATIVREGDALLTCATAPSGSQLRSMLLGEHTERPSLGVLFPSPRPAAVQAFAVGREADASRRLRSDFADLLQRVGP